MDGADVSNDLKIRYTLGKPSKKITILLLTFVNKGTRQKKNVENSTFGWGAGPGHFPHFKKKSGV